MANLPQNAAGFPAVGCVQNIEGTVKAVDANGNSRTLFPGDFIYANETIDASQGGITLMDAKDFEAMLVQMAEEDLTAIAQAEQEQLAEKKAGHHADVKETQPVESHTILGTNIRMAHAETMVSGIQTVISVEDIISRPVPPDHVFVPPYIKEFVPAASRVFMGRPAQMTEGSINHAYQIEGMAQSVSDDIIFISLKKALAILADPNSSAQTLEIHVDPPGIILNNAPGHFEFDPNTGMVVLQKADAALLLEEGGLKISTCINLPGVPNDQDFMVISTLYDADQNMLYQYQQPVIVDSRADGLLSNQQSSDMAHISDMVTLHTLVKAEKVELSTELNLKFADASETHTITINLPEKSGWTLTAEQLQAGWEFDPTQYTLTIVVPPGLDNLQLTIPFQVPLSDYLKNPSNYGDSITVNVNSVSNSSDQELDSSNNSKLESIIQTPTVLPGLDILQPISILTEHSRLGSPDLNELGDVRYSHTVLIDSFIQLLGDAAHGSFGDDAIVKIEVGPTANVCLIDRSTEKNLVESKDGILTLTATELNTIYTALQSGQSINNFMMQIFPNAGSGADFQVQVSTMNIGTMDNLTFPPIPVVVDNMVEGWDISASLNASVRSVGPEVSHIHLDVKAVLLGMNHQESYEINIPLPGNAQWQLTGTQDTWKIITNADGSRTLQGTLSAEAMQNIHSMTLPVDLQVDTKTLTSLAGSLTFEASITSTLQVTSGDNDDNLANNVRTQQMSQVDIPIPAQVLKFKELQTGMTAQAPPPIAQNTGTGSKSSVMLSSADIEKTDTSKNSTPKKSTPELFFTNDVTGKKTPIYGSTEDKTDTTPVKSDPPSVDNMLAFSLKDAFTQLSKDPKANIHFILTVNPDDASNPNLILTYQGKQLHLTAGMNANTIDIHGTDLINLYQAYQKGGPSVVNLVMPVFGSGYYDIDVQMNTLNAKGEVATNVVYPHQAMLVDPVVSGFVGTPSITQHDTSTIFQLTNNRVNVPLDAHIKLRDSDGSESMTVSITLPNFMALVKGGLLPGDTPLDVRVGAPWQLDATTGVATRTFTGEEIKAAKGDFSNLPIDVSFNAAALPYMSMPVGKSEMTLTPKLSITVVDHGSVYTTDATQTTTADLKVTVSAFDLKPHLTELTQEITATHPFDPEAAVKNHQAISVDITQTLQALEKTLGILLKQAIVNGYQDFPKGTPGDVLEAAIKADLFNSASIKAEFFATYPAGAMPILYGGGQIVGDLTKSSLITTNSTVRQIVEEIKGDDLQAIYEAWENNKTDSKNSTLFVTSAPGLDADFSIKVNSTVPHESSDNTLSRTLDKIDLMSTQNFIVDASATKPIIDIHPHLSLIVNPPDLLNVGKTLTGTYAKIYFDVNAHFPNAKGGEDSKITVTLDPSKFVYPPGDPNAGKPIANMVDFNRVVGPYLPKESDGWINVSGLTFVKDLPNNTSSDVSTQFYIQIPINVLPSGIGGNLLLGNVFTQNMTVIAEATTTENATVRGANAGGSGLEYNLTDNVQTTKETAVFGTQVIELNKFHSTLDVLSAQGTAVVNDVTAQAALAKKLADNVKAGNLAKISIDDALAALTGHDLSDDGVKITISFKNIDPQNPPDLFFNELGDNFSKVVRGDTVTYTLSGNALQTAWVQYHDKQYTDANGVKHTVTLDPNVYIQSNSGDDFTLSVSTTNERGQPIYTSSDVQIFANAGNTLSIDSSTPSPTVTANYTPHDETGRYISGTAADTYAVDKITIPIHLKFDDGSSSAKRYVTIELPKDAAYNWGKAFVVDDKGNVVFDTNGVPVDSLNGWVFHKGVNGKPDTLTKAFDSATHGVINDEVSLTFNKNIYTEIANSATPNWADTIKVFAESYSVTEKIPADPYNYKYSLSGSANATIGIDFEHRPTTVTNNTVVQTGDTANFDVIGANVTKTVQPGKGDDTVIGNAKSDKISETNMSSGGNDFLVGGRGRDFLQAGAGNDVLYAQGTTGMTINNTVDVGQSYDFWLGNRTSSWTKFNIMESDNAKYTHDDVTRMGTMHANTRDIESIGNITDILVGGSGNDIINTQNTNVATKAGSLVLAGSGNDTVISGWGSDIVFLNDANSIKVSTIPHLHEPSIMPLVYIPGHSLSSPPGISYMSLYHIGEYDEHNYVLAKVLISQIEEVNKTGTGSDNYVLSFMNFEKNFMTYVEKAYGIQNVDLQKEFFTQKVAYLIEVMSYFYTMSENNNIVDYDDQDSTALQRMLIYSMTDNDTVLKLSKDQFEKKLPGYYAGLSEESKEMYQQLMLFADPNGPDGKGMQIFRTELSGNFDNDSDAHPGPIGFPGSFFGISGADGSVPYDDALSKLSKATTGDLSIIANLSAHPVFDTSSYALTQYDVMVNLYGKTEADKWATTHTDIKNSPMITADNMTYNFVYTDVENSGVYNNPAPHNIASGSDTLVYTAKSVIHEGTTADLQQGQSIDTIYYFNYGMNTAKQVDTSNQSHINISGLLDDLGVSADHRSIDLISYKDISGIFQVDRSSDAGTHAVQVGIDLKLSDINMTDAHVKDLINTGVANGNIIANHAADGSTNGYHIALANLAGVTQDQITTHAEQIFILQQQQQAPT